MLVVPDNARHIGARERQQDAFGFSDLEHAELTRAVGALSVVADGMGGMEQGDEMSRLACRAMIDAYTRKAPEESIPEALHRALHETNAAVLSRATELDSRGRSGTTLVAAVIHDGGLHWASVGDTRAYLLRRGRLTRLTVDHKFDRDLERQVAAGDLAPEAAAQHPDRHALTSYIGLDAVSRVDRTVRPFPLERGDRVVLCTDGIHGVVSDADICTVLNAHPHGAAQPLVDAVMARGVAEQDNATVTVMAYGAADRLPAPTGTERRPLRRGPRRLWPRGVVLVAAAASIAAVLVLFVASEPGREAGWGGRARSAVDRIVGWVRPGLPAVEPASGAAPGRRRTRDIPLPAPPPPVAATPVPSPPPAEPLPSPAAPAANRPPPRRGQEEPR